ncbi:hypothetical protein FA13DRAFT_1819087 [Coprinellus micaceus]|uniref:Zn(2)-C6 fungal-type domain-containing protein n=1 Tax=Coprinellus micaceus TaxID=71717 RepID=A0A4Y7SLV2_COPMI|nr:hypothetical protein FA13DRAFT_1819087 [Coprinellus micaceus]
MPVDTTRVISTRRTQKQISEEELKDIELKRLRGELSCAECRRLKLKCDKKVPCSSCVRRGCESICPCGILSAGQGTRFILADTDRLHRKISEMSTRIRQLEDALAIMQASVADERHPLLNDDLLKVKFGGEALEHKPPDARRRHLRQRGDRRPGHSGIGGGRERDILWTVCGIRDPYAEEDADEGEHEDDQEIPLPPEIDRLSGELSLLASRRPNASWPSTFGIIASGARKSTHPLPVKREQLLDQLLPNTYDSTHAKAQARANGSPSADPLEVDDSSYAHALASLFFIFSLGALFDITLPPYNAQAEHFYHVGRAALSLRKTCPPTLETVQAVGLMATYHSLAGKKYSRDSAWWIMSMAAKLAQSYGLQLSNGSSSRLHLSYVDCEYPEDKEGTLSDSGEIQSGFWRLKHDYARDIFYCVAEATLRAEAPSYKTILDLDKKVREMSFPTSLKPYLSPTDGEELYYSSSLSIRDFYASQNRTVIMIYLHRSFFAQAMLDHPTNPLQSTFAPSFLTAYRCASIIIKATAHHFDRCEELAKRIWFLLYHTFSAAVIVGTIVTRCPTSSMAANALKDLDIAVLLFQKAAPQSQRARIALAVLKRLHDKATKVFSTRADEATSATEGPADDSEETGDIDLAIFGGQARVLTKKSRRRDSVSISKRASASPSNSSEDHGADTSPPPACVVQPTHELQQETLSSPPSQLPHSQPSSRQAIVLISPLHITSQSTNPYH